MTRISPQYDSAHSTEKCSYCDASIRPGTDRIIIGTGNSLLASYHLLCWEIIQAGMEIKDPPPVLPEEGDPSY